MKELRLEDEVQRESIAYVKAWDFDENLHKLNVEFIRADDSPLGDLIVTNINGPQLEVLDETEWKEFHSGVYTPMLIGISEPNPRSGSRYYINIGCIEFGFNTDAHPEWRPKKEELL